MRKRPKFKERLGNALLSIFYEFRAFPVFEQRAWILRSNPYLWLNCLKLPVKLIFTRNNWLIMQEYIRNIPEPEIKQKRKAKNAKKTK